MASRVSTLVLIVLFAACGGGGMEDEEVPVPVPVGARRAQQARADQAVAGDALMREVFSYSGSRRDPFESLLDQANLGPELPDLTLVGVYLDLQNAARNVAVLRERITGRRYTLHEGDRLGRLEVVAIRERSVTFQVDDFGVLRRESLALRSAQEDQSP